MFCTSRWIHFRSKGQIIWTNSYNYNIRNLLEKKSYRNSLINKKNTWSNISCEQFSILDLLWVGDDWLHELDGCVDGELRETVDDDLPDTYPLPGPGDGVEEVVVAEDDRLDGDPGQECARSEGDEAGPVGAGSLGEYEHLLPVLRRAAPLHNLLDCILPRVGIVSRG